MLLPLHIGGGPSEEEKVYQVLRSAVGKGGSAPNELGIDGLWRRARALGLASATSATRRAIYNAFPFLSTDLLPHYERTLGIVVAPDTPDAARRELVAAMWPAKASAVVSDVQGELRRIDSRFTFEVTSQYEPKTTASWYGRWFGSHNGGELPVFGTKTYSDLASPSTRCHAVAFLAVSTPDALIQRDERAVAAANMRLRALMPSWEDCAISVTSDGFILDESPLDWTVLSDG